jgi:hypothetical protein
MPLTHTPRVRIIPLLDINPKFKQQAFEEISLKRLPLFVSALS